MRSLSKKQTVCILQKSADLDDPQCNYYYIISKQPVTTGTESEHRYVCRPVMVTGRYMMTRMKNTKRRSVVLLCLPSSLVMADDPQSLFSSPPTCKGKYYCNHKARDNQKAKHNHAA